jgi:hypothetical protein
MREREREGHDCTYFLNMVAWSEIRRRRAGGGGRVAKEPREWRSGMAVRNGEPACDGAWPRERARVRGCERARAPQSRESVRGGAAGLGLREDSGRRGDDCSLPSFFANCTGLTLLFGVRATGDLESQPAEGRGGGYYWNECSKTGQRAFHGCPSKQKPAPIFVLVD